MVSANRDADSPRITGNPVVVFVSLAVMAASMTGLFLSMRMVMDVGGFCAEGGPFEIAVHCPDGVIALLFGSVFAGVAAGLVYGGHVLRHRIPNVLALLWPALFISLGWNFLEMGFNVPEHLGGGVSWGWLICGVVFMAMGVPVLYWWLKAIIRPDTATITGRLTSAGTGTPMSLGDDQETGHRGWTHIGWAWLHVAAIALGIGIGVWVYRIVS